MASRPQVEYLCSATHSSVSSTQSCQRGTTSSPAALHIWLKSSSRRWNAAMVWGSGLPHREAQQSLIFDLGMPSLKLLCPWQPKGGSVHYPLNSATWMLRLKQKHIKNLDFEKFKKKKKKNLYLQVRQKQRVLHNQGLKNTLVRLQGLTSRWQQEPDLPDQRGRIGKAAPHAWLQSYL